MIPHSPTPWSDCHVVTSSVSHYGNPGSVQQVSHNGSWAVGPLARNRLLATVDCVLLRETPNMYAALQLLAEAWEGATYGYDGMTHQSSERIGHATEFATEILERIAETTL